MSCDFNFDEDEEPTVTEPTYFPSDEGENFTPWSSPDHYPAGNHSDSYDATNQMITSQHEQGSASATTTVHCPCAPTTSLVSDDDGKENFTPKKVTLDSMRAMYWNTAPTP